MICPTGCGRRVRAGHLMCGPCWSRVPRELQRDVNRTWKAYAARRPGATGIAAAKDNAEARTKAREAYRAAADAAITAAG